MTATFTDYVAQKDAQNTIQLNVTKYCFMLCDALLKNYINESIRRHEFFMATDKQEYHQACIEDLQNGNCGYEFTVESGRKYHKIMMSAIDSPKDNTFIVPIHALMNTVYR